MRIENKYYIAKKISSVMLHNHLPELTVKASNEAKNVGSVLKYIAFIVLAISTVTVCALFVKISLLPGKSYNDHSFQGIQPSTTVKTPAVEDKEEVYIGLNIEVAPNPTNSIKEEDPTKLNSSQENILLKQIPLKSKPLNSHVFQSVTSPQPKENIISIKNPLFKGIINPNLENSETNEKLMNFEAKNKSFLQPFDDMFPFFSSINEPDLIKSDNKNLDQTKSDYNVTFKLFDPFQPDGPLDLMNFLLEPSNFRVVQDNTSNQHSNSEEFHSKLDDSNITNLWPLLDPLFNFEDFLLNSSLLKPTNSNEDIELLPYHESNDDFFKFPSFDSFFDSDEISSSPEIDDSFPFFGDGEHEPGIENTFSNKDRFPSFLNNNDDDLTDKILTNIFHMF